MHFFEFGLTIASVICVAGVLRRIALWWRPTAKPASNPQPRPVLSAIKSLVLDVLLLARTFRTSPLRWLAHCLVFFGFMGLLLFHALDDTVTVYFFPAYESTLDPWQFLRNLFAAMTLAGLGLMVYRRLTVRRLRLVTRTQDWAILLAVACIILSGVCLEMSKIISPAVYERMTDEFFFPEDGREATALKAFWAHEYGVVFSRSLPADAATLEMGAELNEDNCGFCHDDTRSAFVSRSLATAMAPLSPAMNTSRADTVFWYFHMIFCFIGLAAIPFAKFFHPLSTPANMVLRRGRRDGTPDSPLAQRMGIDACTRCGECSVRCSVVPSFSVLGNPDILPSEKLISLKRFWSDESLTGESLADFSQGSRICTECLRCTDICPSGINLQDLWLQSKRQVADRSPDPNGRVRLMRPSQRVNSFEDCDIVPPIFGLADNAESYWACVQCTTCTSVCPVVAVCEDPSADLDLTPQQIMNLLRMGLKDQTLGARMVWSCTTCYKCQEHCPQNIRVADVLYELRNTAAARMGCGGRADTDGESQ